MDGLISVVVPVYNVEKYLKRCIDSICAQSYTELEIILVDDGSTDSSGSMCDEFAIQDKRIWVIHKENGGLSDARNAGMQASTGEYICFIDSDDWIEPDILQIAMESLQSNNADISIWSFYKDFVDSDENVTQQIMVGIGDHLCEKAADSAQVLLSDSALAMVGYAWNKLYRKSVIMQSGVRFEKGVSLVEDILFNSPVLVQANKLVFLSHGGTHYIQRNRETLGAKFYDNYYDLKIMACKAREALLAAYGIEQSKITEAMANSYFSAIKSSCRMACQSRQMDYKDRQQYIKTICTSQQGRASIRHYRAKGKDWLFQVFLRMGQYWIFETLYSR